MSAWLHLEHPDIDAAPVAVPDDPAVREHYEARGWAVVDAPGDAPFVSPVDAGEQAERIAAGAVEGAEVDGVYGQAWVELVHPLEGVDGQEARCRVPADPAAVQGLLDLGWVLPRKTDGGVPAPVRRRARKAAEQEAAHEPAAEESTPDAGAEQSTSGPADTQSSADDTKEQ